MRELLRRSFGWALALLSAIGLPGCNRQEPKPASPSQPKRPISQETVRFHEIVENGSLADLDRVLQQGVDVNASGRNGSNALIIAIASRDIEKTRLLLQNGADPELADDFNRTALRCAVDVDFADGVECLLGLGVDRGYQPKYPLKAIDHDMPGLEPAMPQESQSIMSDAEWKASVEQTRQMMRDRHQNPIVEPMMGEIQSVAVLKLFLRAGDELNLAPKEIQRALLGLETSGELTSGLADYQSQKSPRYGIGIPERMDLEFWRDMIRTGGNAYTARLQFEDTDPFTKPGVVWCYDRFGASLTQLPDGRVVQIGGEHEDYYDPDFHIYNDVVIHDGHGEFEIYGYSRAVFPPTDFHTATLCQDGIYVIGCLGYTDERRSGYTPIFRLTLGSWEMSAIKTTGEMPGWIHKHRARYDPERNVIRVTGGEIHVVESDGEQELVPNREQFELGLGKFEWHRVK